MPASLVFALLFFPAPSIAATGEITIHVSIANKLRVIEGVELHLVSRSGEERTGISDKKGRIHLANMPPGLYELRATKEGFTRVQEPSIRIRPEKTSQLVIEMRESPYTLEEVLVVARAVETGSKASVSATFVDRESLRSAPGSGSDVMRALDGLPGLVSTGEYASFTVRGRSSKDNLILVDGIPFDNVVHFSESFGESQDVESGGRYSIFAPNLIHGADFQAGGWGAAHSGRSGSLLNLQVAEGNPDSSQISTRLDLAGLELTYDGPSRFHNNTSILFSARKLDFGQFFETIGVDDLGSPELTDIIFKSSSQLNQNNKFDFLAIYAPEKFVRTIDNVVALNDDGEIEDLSLNDIDKLNELYAATWNLSIGDHGELSQKVYYRNTDNRTTLGEAYPDSVPAGTPIGDIPLRENIITLRDKENEMGWRTDYSHNNSLGELSAGIQFTQIDIDYDTTLNDDWINYVYDQSDYRPDTGQKFILLVPETANSHYAQKEQAYGAYIEQLFDVSNWKIRAGLRYDYDGFADENLISPRFGANWDYSPLLSFSATAGIFYQSPHFIDRARDEINNNLENEKLSQISLGFKQYFGNDWHIIGESYYQDRENIVTPPDRVSGQSSNNGVGESYGLDIVVNKQFTESWSANISYSFNDSVINNRDGLGEMDSDFNRPHALSLGAVWEINERWKLSARWKFQSGMPSNAYIVNENVLGDGEPLRFSQEFTSINSERQDNYQTLNFRVDYQRFVGFADLIAFVDVINLLAQDVAIDVEFNERTGEYKAEEGEALPLLGFRLEF